MMRCSPEWASSHEVPSGKEEVNGGADEGSSVQLFGPKRNDVAQGSLRVQRLDQRGSEGGRRR
jgi:hypothetical protein